MITYDCANCSHAWQEERPLEFSDEKCPECKSWAIAETQGWDQIGWDHDV